MTHQFSENKSETPMRWRASVMRPWAWTPMRRWRKLATIPISLHCWQGDDVGGFEARGGELSGGLAATGNYPGKARTADELRPDLDQAYSLIPGKHRLNLHAIYAETGGARWTATQLRPEHFAGWTAWAKEKGHGLDFNPTLFSHPKADSGFTLASYDAGMRKFWIDHCIACREIGESFGRELGTPCVTNIWIPDGIKDTPADRKTPRLPLKDALDKILAEPVDRSTTWTRSRASCSASAPRAIPSARTSSTWATRWPTRRCVAWTAATITPPRPSRTNCPRC